MPTEVDSEQFEIIVGWDNHAYINSSSWDKNRCQYHHDKIKLDNHAYSNSSSCDRNRRQYHHDKMKKTGQCIKVIFFWLIRMDWLNQMLFVVVVVFHWVSYSILSHFNSCSRGLNTVLWRLYNSFPILVPELLSQTDGASHRLNFIRLGPYSLVSAAASLFVKN